MNYNYEALNAESFQEFCQALLVTQFPNVQCMPVAQPDGGRDAVRLRPESGSDGFIVFQVKFVNDPRSKTERDAVIAAVKSEKEKVKGLIARGASEYYLLTNVQGTGHQDSGSIDRANRDLTSEIGISSMVWWRDDLSRRLENYPNIKLSYPQLLTGGDVLSLLVSASNAAAAKKIRKSVKNFIATQYETDKDLKFKQVELSHKLTSLFVDIPIRRKHPPTEESTRLQESRANEPLNVEDYFGRLSLFEREGLLDEMDILEEEFLSGKDRPPKHSGLAAALILNMPLFNGVCRLVLEGAPGQGKSTVTQFICQIHRLRLLGKSADLTSVQDIHKSCPVRLPLRVDLRDFASWTAGNHPFAADGEALVPPPGSRSLESFLAMLVSWRSGGINVSAAELFDFFERSHCVIILDGFDEVADIEVRKQLIEEINQAAARLESQAKSLQLIVTSRPAAFANSPGFPEDEWRHLELMDMRRANIEAYKDNWLTSQRLSEEEGKHISATLEEKLELPHLRDLARNPMQLTILLQLIHVQGVALPDKRTALYEEYIKIFFNRESEKSSIVRDHRELLLSVHGVLAWVLHTQAEGGGLGHLSKDELHVQVKDYLESVGHEPELAELLLTGTVERVGALVSRLEGTYEFEVQPLREYFAARYLYKTAPYSPVGTERSGTRPERFEALAASFYWTNVTRFFCGFYDSGELSGLVEGITALSDKDGYGLINQPRALAMMLLSDQVFSLDRRVMNRLIGFFTSEPGFRRIATDGSLAIRDRISLPPKSGGEELYRLCAKKLETEQEPMYRQVLREVMAANGSQDHLLSTWNDRFLSEVMVDNPFKEAEDFRIAHTFDPKDVVKHCKGDVNLAIRWLVWAGHFSAIENDSSLFSAAREAFFAGKLGFHRMRRFSEQTLTPLEMLTAVLRPHAFSELFRVEEGAFSIDVSVVDFLGVHDWKIESEDMSGRGVEQGKILEFARFVRDLVDGSVGLWRESLERWTALVDRGFEEAPANDLMAQIAAVSTSGAVPFSVVEDVWTEQAFSATKGLVERLHFAKGQCDNCDWWRKQIVRGDDENRHLCLSIFLSWGTTKVIDSMKQEISSILHRLSSSEWVRVWNLVRLVCQFDSNSEHAFESDWFAANPSIGLRLALALVPRTRDQKALRTFLRPYVSEYEYEESPVLFHAAQIELLALEESDANMEVDWNYVKRLSRRARTMGMNNLGITPWTDSSKVPHVVAKEVLSRSEEHIAQFVALCERRYATHVAENAPRVYEIAESDGWFVDSD